jgi:hypothetical protein
MPLATIGAAPARAGGPGGATATSADSTSAAPPLPVVARSIVGGSSAGPRVDPPTTERATRPATFAPTASPVIQRVDGSAPPPPTEPRSGHSDDELDELAGALFGRFRDRLRREYIHERESKGLTFDNV